MDEHEFSLTLTLRDGYTFDADFGLAGVPALTVDEPPPLGAGRGPNPTRLLGAAIGNCLGASLLFCLQKARIPVEGLRTTVEGTLVRNERGRLRIGRLRTRLEPTVPAGYETKLGRCLELFEDFCIVTESVREGIDVAVEVVPAATAEAARV